MAWLAGFAALGSFVDSIRVEGRGFAQPGRCSWNGWFVFSDSCEVQMNFEVL
jgi:hypothetical protein